MAEQWRFFGSTLQDIHSQLGSTCHATLLNGIKYTGYLYSVDPETYTALLLLNRKKESDGNPPHSQSEKDTTETALNKEGAWTMVAVRQHAIKSWECSESTSSNRLSLAEMDTLAHIAQILGDLEEINARKDRLVALLRSVRNYKIAKSCSWSYQMDNDD
ncbi:hypothetical protein BGZ49_010868 [Haplosporangium sp. Z 27]|nr:hypothetical protein BGZ49_010868 [Haplosporangium sp. Z 27]